MCKMSSRLYCAMMVLAVALAFVLTAPASAQTTEPPETQTQDGDGGSPSTAHPPAYMNDLMTETGLTQLQVDGMRADGMGWGEIRIASRLAEQMAANSDGTLTFTDALNQVLAARAEGKGYGEIAAANNLKVGNLVKNDKAAGGSSAPQATGATAKEKKPGLLARIGKALGFGRSSDPSAGGAKSQVTSKDMKGNKPERPMKHERGFKPERLERPTIVDKPVKPERPERGPSR